MEGLSIVILHMIERIEGERSVAGCYHILTGKKSGQAIQDAALFDYQSWYGLFPNWERSSFERTINQLILSGKLVPSLTGDSYVLSPQMRKELAPLLERYHFSERAFLLQKRSIHLQGVHTFWNRFQLLAQVISYFLSEKSHFNPIVSDIEIQRWVKHFWSPIKLKEEFVKQINTEFSYYLSLFEDKLFSHLILDRLSGADGSGRTFLQMSQIYQIPEAIIRIYFFQAIGLLYRRIQEDSPSCLKRISEINNSQNIHVTKSTQQTYLLLQRGHSIEEISQIRCLQQSTIEDHLIEIAIHVPEFDVTNFISTELASQVLKTSSKLKTKKLRLIKNEMKVQEASFFQIRLALVKGCELIEGKRECQG